MKDTNPKDTLGNGRLPLGLVPDSGIALASMAFLEGASKYGRFNWRKAGVRASIYHDAARRHLAKWFNGEDCDEKTGIPHLASVIASAMILIDAEVCGKLTDDRPPSAPISKLVDGLAPVIEHVKALFADYEPYQYTIADDHEQLTASDDINHERLTLEKFREDVDSVVFEDPTDEMFEIPSDIVTDYPVGQHLRETSFGSGLEEVEVISVEEYLKQTGRSRPPHDVGFPYKTSEGGLGWGIASNFEVIE